MTTAYKPPPPIGSLVYVAAAMVRLRLQAEITPPDTPNIYSGKMEPMSDLGLDLSGLQGFRGPPGQALSPLRRQDDPVVRSEAELPTDLTNTTTDRGKYWEIDILTEGVVTDREAWVWMGNRWKMLKMGVRGPVGAPPRIFPQVKQIDIQRTPTGRPADPWPDTTSYINPSGPKSQPTWEFGLAVPQGLHGPVSAVNQFPDVEIVSPEWGDLLACSGTLNEDGQPIWKMLGLEAFASQFYSMPQSSFAYYTGVSQQAAIGSFALPPQPFPWTAVVWGHIGRGGTKLTGFPFCVGVQVLLGHPNSGIQVARGYGTPLGDVTIMPHYSTPNSKAASISPEQKQTVVPANHTDPSQGTIYVNLWNDGQFGAYSFDPTDAQIFVLVMPMLDGVAIAPF